MRFVKLTRRGGGPIHINLVNVTTIEQEVEGHGQGPGGAVITTTSGASIWVRESVEAIVYLAQSPRTSIMEMSPDLEAALRAWVTDFDHLDDDDLDEGNFEQSPGPLDAALIRAARRTFAD